MPNSWSRPEHVAVVGGGIVGLSVGCSRTCRGYSFSIPADPPVTRPILFPGAKIAMTPRSGRLSISGVMEIGRTG